MSLIYTYHIFFQTECENAMDIKTKRCSRTSSIKVECSEETSSVCVERRVTRRNLGKSKSSCKLFEISEESKSIKRNSKSKSCNLMKHQEPALNCAPNASASSVSKSSLWNRSSPKKSSRLPEGTKGTKVYSLRHSSLNPSKKIESSDVTGNPDLILNFCLLLNTFYNSALMGCIKK